MKWNVHRSINEETTSTWLFTLGVFVWLAKCTHNSLGQHIISVRWHFISLTNDSDEHAAESCELGQYCNQSKKIITTFAEHSFWLFLSSAPTSYHPWHHGRFLSWRERPLLNSFHNIKSGLSCHFFYLFRHLSDLLLASCKFAQLLS